MHTFAFSSSSLRRSSAAFLRSRVTSLRLVVPMGQMPDQVRMFIVARMPGAGVETHRWISAAFSSLSSV